MTRCKVCNNPNRSTIDRELMAGVVSDRSLAAQFNVSKQSLGRHRAHIRADLDLARSEAAHERAEALDTYSLRMRARIEGKLDDLDALIAGVRSNEEACKLDPRMLLAAIRGMTEVSRELRGWVSELRELEGDGGTRQQVVVILPAMSPPATPAQPRVLRPTVPPEPDPSVVEGEWTDPEN